MFNENDLLHRVIVSGDGWGTDDINANDGFGGSGCGLSTYWLFVYGTNYKPNVADQTFGFAFEQGENADHQMMHAGANNL